MLDNIVSTLNRVDAAIKARELDAAQASLTHALLQIVDLYGHDDSFMRRLFPVLAALRKELQHTNFEDARVINLTLLARFECALKTLSPPHEPISSGTTNQSQEHETAWAQELDELNERLRASGLTVTFKKPLEKLPPLVASFPQGRRPKPE